MPLFSVEKSRRFSDAARDGNLALVKSLSVDPEVNLNWQDVFGGTAFYLTCRNGHVDIVRYLLHFRGNQKEPLNYNLADRGGTTPFFFAVEHGHGRVIELLLEDERIDVNQADGNERTPLWWAAYSGDLGVVKILLASTRKVEILRRDDSRRTAAEIARERGADNDREDWESEEEFQQRKKGFLDITALIELYQRDPEGVKAQLRGELGYPKGGAQNGERLKARRKKQTLVSPEEQRQERDKLVEKVGSKVGIESFQTISKCSICRDDLRNPKTLPCLHSFCLGCLESQTQKGPGFTLLSSMAKKEKEKEKQQTTSTLVTPPHRCGLCTAPFAVPERGLSSLESSPLLTSILASTPSTSSATPTFNPNDVKCQLCEEEEASNHCRECDQFLGPRCSATHRRIPATKHHQLQSVDDYFAATGGTRAATKRISRCQEHPAFEIDTYCKTCKVILCLKCLAATHSGHQFGPLGEETERLKGELIEPTATIAVREREAARGIEKFVESLGKLTEERRTAGEDLAKAFASLREGLDRREVELLVKLEDREREIRKAVQLEKEEVEFAYAEFKGYREMSEAILAGGSDVEVARGHLVMIARGKTLDEIGFLSEPSEKGGVKFEARNLEGVEKALSLFGDIR